MDETTTRPRHDAWYAPLSEAERWAVYERSLTLPWNAVAEWVESRYGIAVSRSGFYRFLDWMRPQLSAHRLEQAVLAREEAKGLAEAAGARKEIADAFVAMGSEIALRTNSAEAATEWIKMAAQLMAAAQKDREIELRAEAQRLDREKFEAAEKRLAAVKSAVEDARKAPGGLTPETLKRIEEAAGLL